MSDADNRSGPRVTIPEPIDPVPSTLQDSWGDSRAAGRPLTFKAKAVLALVGAVVLVGGLTYLSTGSPKPEGETVDLSEKNAPFMSSKTQQRVSQSENTVPPKCDEEFTVGSYTVLRDVRDGVPLVITNNHVFRIMVKLYNEDDQTQFYMVGLEPKSDEEVVLPAGKFRMEAFSGNDWCNPDLGFKDGVRIDLKGAVQLKDDKTTKLEFVSEGTKPGDFLPRLFQSAIKQDTNTSKPKTPSSDSENGRSAKGKASKGKAGESDLASARECPAPEPQRQPPPYEISEGDGTLRLRPLAGGNYFVTGMANNFPVVYVVDTGAPTVVLPQVVAARAGIRSCVQKTIPTHLGHIKGCFAHISELEFGQFRVRNVEAMILQGPTGDAVLGMTLLKRFRVEQNNGVIQIGKANLG